jgi:hypothetical protein
MKRSQLFALLLAAIITEIAVEAIWSQQPASRSEARPTIAPVIEGGEPVYYPSRSDLVHFRGANHSLRSEITRLANQLRDADESKKAELTKELETAVSKYFDEDLKARENELTKLEERVKKLRSQLDRRRTAKDEVVQLQIKVMINEVEGLGFSGSLSGLTESPSGLIMAYPSSTAPSPISVPGPPLVPAPAAVPTAPSIGPRR